MTNKYVLVADDEPKMRRVLEIALQKMGHQVAVAGNGREAADIVAAGGVDPVSYTHLTLPTSDLV